MSTGALRTVLVGFGRIAQGYAKDRLMAEHFPFATHAQVLQRHPDFDWKAVVDPSPEALIVARHEWKVDEAVPALEELAAPEQMEVAVIATPPNFRTQVLEALPSLRAVIVEKPLGTDLSSSREFLDICRQRNILVQVNLLRRGDQSMRELASGRLCKLLGSVQTAFGVYGNGLLNNGTHTIDLIRMILGDIKSVTTLGGKSFKEGPLADDLNLPLVLQLESEVSVCIQPISFENYREIYLDIWGERGRLVIAQEGLSLLEYVPVQHRAFTAGQEIACDRPTMQQTNIGTAQYELYSNLAEAIRGDSALLSPGESALKTSRVIEAAFESASRGGCVIDVGVPR